VNFTKKNKEIELYY